jgi:hypothetical protein
LGSAGVTDRATAFGLTEGGEALFFLPTQVRVTPLEGGFKDLNCFLGDLRRRRISDSVF